MKTRVSFSKMISLLLVNVLFLFASNQLFAQVSEDDKAILLDLYTSTNGDSWTNNTNWGSAEPVSTWYGITVLGDEIIEIELDKNNLDGTIPSSLGQLTFLEFLKLDTNNISGSIPVELGNLAVLQQLYLSGNQLTGNIPSSLGLLSNLRWLNLRDNQLSGAIPTELGLLSQLEYLQLSKNQLSGNIPTELGSLSNLKWLNLGENLLDGNIPTQLGGLSELEQLYLNGNQLVNTIPTELGLLTTLRWLNLGQNQLTGAIPSELGSLLSLELLYLDGNELNLVPTELGLLTGLSWLNLSDNLFEGDIPVEIWNLSNLQLLYLNQNQFSGTIPADLSVMTSLRWLYLNSNQLTSIPDLTVPNSLLELRVDNNKLTFADLEPNMDLKPAISLFYNPQDSIGDKQNVIKAIGDSYSYTLNTGGTQNSYQWYKDGSILGTQTTATLDIPVIAQEDEGIYHCEVTNSLVSGLTLSSREIELILSGSIDLSFTTGWNLFSLPVMPDDINLKNILQPLIDEGKLVKVINQSGQVIEDYGVDNGGWQNNIGDIVDTEGYQINVLADANLQVQGTKSQLPFDINLSIGWNIISWPSMNEQDGLDVFQDLINDGVLKKVIDEEGNVIEDYGVDNGGWQNFIGNLKPGKGYKVNVTEASTLTITEDVAKSAQFDKILAETSYFNPVFKGKGVNHMNVSIVNLSGTEIQIDDEIGVFDGEQCVGSFKLNNEDTPVISLAASADDYLTQFKDGFVQGNDISLKLFRNGVESDLYVIPVDGNSLTFEKNGTVFLELKSTVTSNSEINNNDYQLSFYPNPFTEVLNISVKSVKNEIIVVEIYDLSSRKVIQLYKGKTQGNINVQWDGADMNGNKVAPGIYLCRVNDTFKKIILN